MSETMQLVKVDPKEFGIEEARAKEIAAQFKPMLDKMAELEEEFNRIMKLPVTPENIRLFKECRLKYVKTRTGTADIHKKQKAYFRAGGLYCDAWKNTQSFASIGKEDALMEREKHFENLEKERIENLRAERWESLSKYMEVEPQGLGQMDEAVYNHFLNGAKTAHEEKIAAEKKAEAERLENERIIKQRNDRERILMSISGVKQPGNNTFVLWNLENKDFSNIIDFKDVLDCEEKQFESYLQEFKATESANEEYLEEQRKENERLKIEAEKREKAIADERKKQAEKEAKERAEREKERAAMEAKLKAEADAREKAEREIREKKEAEEKARKKAEAEAKKEAKAPVKSKMKNAVESLEMVRFTNMEPEEHSLWLKITEKHEAFKKWALEQIETL